MDINKKIACKLRSDIKRLYKEYDRHLDCVTKLDDLLNVESDKVQECYHEIEKCSRYLNELEVRGKVLPAVFSLSRQN